MIKKFFKRNRIEDYEYIVSKEDPFSYTAESFQKTIINLEYANIDKKYQVIEFTSTLEGEGKTTIISNISYLLRQRGKKVLIIDLDLRRPKIHRLFNVANKNGLNDYLLEKVSLNDAIKKDTNLDIDFIVTGQTTTSIANILSSDKLKDLISELKGMYDYILLDAPPVLAVSDALFIAELSDGIINIVAQNKARKKDVRESLNTLLKTDVPVIGNILTQVKMPRSNKNYYYYGEDDNID